MPTTFFNSHKVESIAGLLHQLHHNWVMFWGAKVPMLYSIVQERGLNFLKNGLLKSDAVISTTIPGLEYPRPYNPNVFFVGPFIENTSFLSLPEVLLNNSNKQYIVISFGSEITHSREVLLNVKYSLQMLKKHFNFTPIILDSSLTKPNLNEELLEFPWLDLKKVFLQLDVLVLISHGGANTVQEALFHGIPSVLIPNYGDQFAVADRISRIGAGIKVESQSTLDIYNSLLCVLQQPEFKANALVAQTMLKNTRGLQHAVEVVNLVLTSYKLWIQPLQFTEGATIDFLAKFVVLYLFVIFVRKWIK